MSVYENQARGVYTRVASFYIVEGTLVYSADLGATKYEAREKRHEDD